MVQPDLGAIHHSLVELADQVPNIPAINQPAPPNLQQVLEQILQQIQALHQALHPINENLNQINARLQTM